MLTRDSICWLPAQPVLLPYKSHIDMHQLQCLAVTSVPYMALAELHIVPRVPLAFQLFCKSLLPKKCLVTSCVGVFPTTCRKYSGEEVDGNGSTQLSKFITLFSHAVVRGWVRSSYSQVARVDPKESF